MQAAEHDAAFARKVGIPQRVATEFVAADKAAGKFQPRKGRPMGKRHEEKGHTHADPYGHGISPRKAIASGAGGHGNFGVEPLEEANGHAGIHPDHRAHTGAKPHLEDHERGAGPGVHHTKGHHPAQAAPDHGPHHIEGYNEHDYGGKV